MSDINALDNRITLPMFLDSLKGRFQKLLAGTMTPEEKLAAIVRELTADVQEKRVLARQIRAQQLALKDPDTAALEPLEALEARREKLVKLGGQNLDKPEMLGQIQQEIKGLDAMIASNTATYSTLEESYKLAMANYKTALTALDNARVNGPAILNAIRAHQEALKMRDAANKQNQVDASFMNDLMGELQNSQAELRSDKEIENDVDATKAGSLDAALAAMDAGTVDESLMAEFRAASNPSSAAQAASAAATYEVTVKPTN